MKKQIITLIILILLPMVASAQDAVVIDDIYYILDSDAKTAMVTTNPDKYTGDVAIPKSVEYGSVTYEVTSIEHHAFYNCTGLTSLYIPKSVTSIGGVAVYNTTSLASIQVEEGNKFYDSRNCCNAIIRTASNTLVAGCMNTIIPSNITTIDKYAFYGCVYLKNATIPNSVTIIREGAFYGCKSLTNINIPYSVTSIEQSAFGSCKALTSIIIPNSVTSIEEGVFTYCSSLTNVTIGKYVTQIKENAFQSCTNLTDIFCLAEDVPQLNSRAFNNCSTENITMHVPAASVDAYKASEQWGRFKIMAIEDTPKCATPTITNDGGELSFSCDTEDVEFVYDVKFSGANSGKGSKLQLAPAGTYTLSVYATKPGYMNSDTATQEIVIKGVRGDGNYDGEVDAVDLTKLIEILLQ